MKRGASSVSAPRGAPSGLTSGARSAIARTKLARAKLDAMISGVVLDGGPAAGRILQPDISGVRVSEEIEP